MKYIVCADRNGNTEILDSYETEDSAVKRLKYHMRKEKCGLRVFPLPDIKVGTVIYNKDGAFYGNVVYETDCLWGISKSTDNEGIADPYSKKRIEQLIVKQGLIVVDGEDISDKNMMIEMSVEVNQRVDTALKGMEYLKAEQVTFFKARK